MRSGAAAIVVWGGLAACGQPEDVTDVDPPDAREVDAGGVPDDTLAVDAGSAGDAAIDAAIDACADGMLGAGETDVDCGGPTCSGCQLGQRCASTTDCATGVCATSTGRCEPLGAVSFASPVFYASGFKPYFVRAGDLDADGDLDLVVGNEQASAVAMFRNIGASSGVFQRIDEYPTGEYPTGGAICDLDRDGIADVITADYHGDSVSVLLGRGTGTSYELGAPTIYPTVADGETSNLAVGHLDGDGFLDVIATNPQAGSASVFFGRAGGALVPGAPIVLGAAGTNEPYSVAIGDFNGDGRNDAALADDRTATVFIRLGNGDGTFQAAPLRPAIGGSRSHILIAHDMDGDGGLDLVIASRSSNSVSVLLGRGDGAFDPARVTSTGAGTGPYSLAVADFDRDGIPDVVTANYITSTASVLLGRGDGTFDVTSAGVTGGTSYGVAAGDFDGDGKPDLAIANAGANTLAIVRNLSN